MSCLYNIFFKTNSVYAINCEPSQHEYQINDCAICLDLLNSETLTMPCGHTFHTTCILTWFDRQMNCPVCRKKFKWEIKKNKKNKHRHRRRNSRLDLR